MNVPLGKWMPRIFGIWSTTMTSPIPALKPTSTGSEMKFATIPRRSTHASKSAAPTSSVKVTDALSRAAAIAVGHDLSQLSGGKDRQGCGRADAEHARGPKHRVYRHRHQGSIKAYLNW